MKLTRYILILLIIAFSGSAVSVCGATRWRVKRVSFEGNEAFRRRTLLNLMELRPKPFSSVRFSSSRLRSDVSSLEGYYRSQGFLNVQIEPEIARDSSRNRIMITVVVDEGKRIKIGALQIVPGKTELDSTMFKPLWSRAGRPLVNKHLNDDADLIEYEFARKGYLEAVVEREIIVDSLSNTANVTFNISEGPLITVDDIRMKGMKSIKPRVVKRELAFKQGEVLTIDRLRKSERQLYRTNLFSRIRIEPVLGGPEEEVSKLPDDAYPVMVSVDEADFFRAEFGLGYGSEEGYRSSVKTSYSNIFGLGHKLALNGNVSQKLQKVETVYSTLWMLGLPLQMDGSLYYNRNDDKANTYFGIFRGARLSVGHLTNSDLAYQVWLKWEDVLKQNEKNTQSVGLGLTYDTRDDLISPQKGVYNLFQAEAAGLTGNNSNQFVKITNDSRLYWKIGKLRFGSGLKLGWVHPYGATDTVPTQERFFGGGPRSVRGFREGHLVEEAPGKSKSGNILLTANIVDFRFPLIWWFNGALFMDAGYVWDDIAGESASALFRDLRWTAGPGIRLNTPIAVIRFDVGFKLDRLKGESLYELHLDVGQPF